jgi:hypothetical protein
MPSDFCAKLEPGRIQGGARLLQLLAALPDMRLGTLREAMNDDQHDTNYHRNKGAVCFGVRAAMIPSNYSCCCGSSHDLDGLHQCVG